MKRLFQVASILLITLGLASFAHAQLAATVDDHGNVIYINAEPPKPAPAKPAAKTTDKASAGGAAGSAAAKPATSEQGAAAPAISAGAADVALPAGAPAAGSAPAQSAASSSAVPPAEYDRAVQESAEKHHVDPELVRAVITTESNWNSAAVSSQGAQGLMQIVPGTARSLGLGNPFDPKQNIDAGVRYLSILLARYNGDVTKAVAAYNAGPGAVDRFGGVPNYRETRNYVQKVTSTYYRPGSARQSRAYDEPAHIYRTQDDSGRVIFVNE